MAAFLSISAHLRINDRRWTGTSAVPLIQLFDGHSSDVDALSSEKNLQGVARFHGTLGHGAESPSSKTFSGGRTRGTGLEGRKRIITRPKTAATAGNCSVVEKKAAATLTHFMNEQKRAPGSVPSLSSTYFPTVTGNHRVYIHNAPRGGFPTRHLINSPYFLHRSSARR